MSYSIVPPDEQSAANEPQIDPVKLEQLMRDIKAKQNLPLGIFGGLVAAVAAATIWAIITYVTNFQIGFMAVGVGFLVGYAVRYSGKGISRSFGIAGAVLALFGCLLGNLLTGAIALSRLEESSTFLVITAFLTSPGIMLEIMKAMFSPIDLLFYAIAVYEGYKISFRQLTEEEIAYLQPPPAQPQPPTQTESQPQPQPQSQQTL
jgi:hypothetical protein